MLLAAHAGTFDSGWILATKTASSWPGNEVQKLKIFGLADLLFVRCALASEERRHA